MEDKRSHKYDKYDEVSKRERDRVEPRRKKDRRKGKGKDKDRSKDRSKDKDVAVKKKKMVCPFKKPKDEKTLREEAMKKAAKKENAPMKSFYKQSENFEEKNALVYDTPRYLLPHELKRVPPKEKKRREEKLQKYLTKKQEPYRCIRTCIDPKTAKIKYQEYICYPPPPCPPSQSQHPQIAFPADCKCDPCSPTSCTSKVCEVVRGLRAEINYEEPVTCEPITVCVPVPDPPPPQMICTDCPLEIRLKDGDFHIINAKNFKKHIKKMNKEMKKLIEDWEKKNQLRKMRIKRFCQ